MDEKEKLFKTVRILLIIVAVVVAFAILLTFASVIFSAVISAHQLEKLRQEQPSNFRFGD
ncbi:MAG: hypothetical protein LBF77_04635 [Spirochaetaceae bacterium]|nr:hypothetical protein [Spirochaetaceae bacterium]